jgi:hypothetical protein
VRRCLALAHGALARALRAWGAAAVSAAAAAEAVGTSGGGGGGGPTVSAAYGPVFSPQPESILGAIIRVDALLSGRRNELRAQKAEAAAVEKEGSEDGSAAAELEGASDAQQRALDRLELLAGGAGGAAGGVQLRHKRLLSDLLTRKARGVAAVQPAPDGWY